MLVLKLADGEMAYGYLVQGGQLCTRLLVRNTGQKILVQPAGGAEEDLAGSPWNLPGGINGNRIAVQGWTGNGANRAAEVGFEGTLFWLRSLFEIEPPKFLEVVTEPAELILGEVISACLGRMVGERVAASCPLLEELGMQTLEPGSLASFVALAVLLRFSSQDDLLDASEAVEALHQVVASSIAAWSRRESRA